jgi:hypothetical protein
MKMKEGVRTNADFESLVQLHIDGMTTAQIAEMLDRRKQAVATKGSRIGLYALTRDGLQEPGVALRDCLNPEAPHKFVSKGIYNRNCISCKQTQIFQAA